MIRTFPQRRGRSVRPAALALAAASLLALAACGTSTGGGGATAGDSLTETDYYEAAPQNVELPKLLSTCADKAGVKVEHQQVPRDQFMPKLLQQASARRSSNQFER